MIVAQHWAQLLKLTSVMLEQRLLPFDGDLMVALSAISIECRKYSTR